MIVAQPDQFRRSTIGAGGRTTIWRRVAGLIGLVIFLCSLSLGGEWGCYDPQPGHPTPDERRKFVDEMRALMPAIEDKYGVPAGALAAMAIQESGYGWTRTALSANNLFGWKFYSKQAAGGRESFTLACQPPEDENNHYVVFADSRDAADFVAGKLASLAYYTPATIAYKEARARGDDVREATRAWVAAIAVHYNWRPQQYTELVTRVMNNPLSPSGEISAKDNLYQLSERAQATSGRMSGSRGDALRTIGDLAGC